MIERGTNDVLGSMARGRRKGRSNGRTDGRTDFQTGGWTGDRWGTNERTVGLAGRTGSRGGWTDLQTLLSMRWIDSLHAGQIGSDQFEVFMRIEKGSGWVKSCTWWANVVEFVLCLQWTSKKSGRTSDSRTGLRAIRRICRLDRINETFERTCGQSTDEMTSAVRTCGQTGGRV